MFTSNTPHYNLSLKQPKALYLLFLVQMWECFSYYGMRTILVVFMLSEMGYDDSRSFGVYAVYTSLVEAGGMIGGYLSDKVFGLKFAIFLGAIIIAIGHILMSVPDNVPLFYLGLSFIIIGTGLFRTNCTAFLGEFYHVDDPRREAGFTIFYVGINIGAFLAAILCAYVGETYGWHFGFSLAAIGMCLGIIILFRYDYLLEDKGKMPENTRISLTIVLCILSAPLIAMMVYYHNIFIHIIPVIGIVCLACLFIQMKSCTKQQKRNIITILLAVLMLTLFFSCEEQIGSTLVLFSERNVDTNVLGYNIPAPSLTTIIALGIILFGPIVSKVLTNLEHKNKSLNPFSKMNLSMLLMSVAFIVLYVGCQFANEEYLVKIDFVVLSFSVIALAEIILAPTVDSLCSKLSPYHLRGMLMGVVTMGYSFANLLSGYLSQFMAVEVGGYGKASLGIYTQGFLQISFGCLVIAVLIAMLIFCCKRWYKFSNN